MRRREGLERLKIPVLIRSCPIHLLVSAIKVVARCLTYLFYNLEAAPFP